MISKAKLKQVLDKNLFYLELNKWRKTVLLNSSTIMLEVLKNEINYSTN